MRTMMYTLLGLMAAGCGTEEIHRLRTLCDLVNEMEFVARVVVLNEPATSEDKMVVEVSTETLFKGNMSLVNLVVHQHTEAKPPGSVFRLPSKGESAYAFASMLDGKIVVPIDGWFSLGDGIAANALMYNEGVSEEKLQEVIGAGEGCHDTP